jgi:hypothetical protein
MKLREALIQQAPSLALQRAAADEIAKQDALIQQMLEALKDLLNAESEYPYSGMSESELDALRNGEAAIAAANNHMESK